MKTILALLLALTLTACAPRLEAPRVSVADVKLIEASLVQQRFEVSLRVVNPNDRQFDIEALEFTLETDGKQVAEGYTRQPFTLPALTAQTVRVETVTTLNKLSRILQDVLAGKISGQGTAYVLRGRVKPAGRDWLPFSKSGRFGENETTTPARQKSL
jgi:LEA14-like dessication related protein